MEYLLRQEAEAASDYAFQQEHGTKRLSDVEAPSERMWMIATAAERRREEKEEEFSRAEVGEMVKGTVEWRGNSVELSCCARLSDNKPN